MQGNMGFGGEFPLGLGLLLADDAMAMERFSSLGDDERQGILDYVQGGVDDDDTKYRASHTVQSLHDGVPGFYRQ